VALSTAFTDLFSIPHPVALAPMGGSAGGELAAAVSAGGGLGLVGGGRGERDWCERELAVATDRTDGAWGIGFLTWALTPATLDTALAHGPAAVMLSFGNPAPFAEDVRRSGARLIVQVTDPNDDAARRAYAEAASTGDLAVIPVWAGEAIDLIRDVPSATDLVPAIVAEAEAALDHASTRR
jgi:nitronate monooxygenase